MTTEVQGYAFGRVDRSPVSMEELAALESAVGWTGDDRGALRNLWDVIGGELEPLFEAFIGRIGHFFVPTFAAADGVVDEAYMAAAHPRFLQWLHDTCLREHDQAWVDYQHEIALRHHRAKKNMTDGANAVEIVPFRYLPLTVPPMTQALQEFLTARGVAADRLEAMLSAWTKSLLLQVSLWSRAYVDDRDW